MLKCYCNTTRGLWIDGNQNCVCQDPKATLSDGYCVTNNFKTPTPTTNGAGKGGGGEGFQTVPATKTESVRFIEKEVRVEKESVLVYVVGVVLGLMVVMMASYQCWNSRRASMKRNQRSFEDPVGMMNISTHSRSPYECELTSVTNRESSLYRPYMNSLGCIVSIIYQQKFT